jgi:hypothetical protein
VTRVLWFGLVGGHLAWTAHLLLSYFLADLACGSDTAELAAGRHILTVVAVVVTGAAAAAVWALRRRASPPLAPNAPAGAGELAAERRFVARFALAASGVFLLAIVLAGATNLFLVPCA